MRQSHRQLGFRSSLGWIGSHLSEMLSMNPFASILSKPSTRPDKKDHQFLRRTGLKCLRWSPMRSLHQQALGSILESAQSVEMFCGEHRLVCVPNHGRMQSTHQSIHLLFYFRRAGTLFFDRCVVCHHSSELPPKEV